MSKERVIESVLRKRLSRKIIEQAIKAIEKYAAINHLCWHVNDWSYDVNSAITWGCTDEGREFWEMVYNAPTCPKYEKYERAVRDAKLKKVRLDTTKTLNADGTSYIYGSPVWGDSATYTFYDDYGD